MIIQSTTQNTFVTDLASNNDKSKVENKQNQTDGLLSTYEAMLFSNIEELISRQQEDIEKNGVATKILDQYNVDKRKTTFEDKNEEDEENRLSGLSSQSIFDKHIQKYMEKGESEKDASERVAIYGFLGLIDVPNTMNASSLLFKKGTTEEFKESLKKSLIIEFDKMSSKDAVKIGSDMVIKDSPGIEWEKLNHDFLENGVYSKNSMNIEYKIKLGDGGKDAFSSTLDMINYIKKEIFELESKEVNEETISLLSSYKSMLHSFTNNKNNKENEIILNQYTRNNNQNVLDNISA